MTPVEFTENVARLVAGLQVPVSIGGSPDGILGPVAGPAWSKLLHEVNGGFGWTNVDACQEAFGEILGVSP